jgi:hypothetical protein
MVPACEIPGELADLDDLLQKRLIPHENQDDAQVYPTVARLIGGADPMAAMSRTHREIRHLSRLRQRMGGDLPQAGPDSSTLAEIQRILYGLEAILRLHFAQEDEIYHSLAEAA